MNIENLLKLQEEDRILRALKHERMVVLPARRAEAKNRKKAAEDAVKVATQENLAAVRELERFQHDYTQSRHQMNRAEYNAAHLTHSRGLKAAQAEYDAAAAHAAQSEAAVARADLTPTERRLDDARAFEAEESVAVQNILTDLDARKAMLDEEIARVQERVSVLEGTIDPATLNYYKRVTVTRWPCVVELNRKTSVCAGCDMEQPLSVKQELLAEEKNPTGKTVYCPSCGRILY